MYWYHLHGTLLIVSTGDTDLALMVVVMPRLPAGLHHRPTKWPFQETTRGK